LNNLNKVNGEASRHFRNKRSEHLEDNVATRSTKYIENCTKEYVNLRSVTNLKLASGRMRTFIPVSACIFPQEFEEVEEIILSLIECT
jgi:hypothetical protein